MQLNMHNSRLFLYAQRSLKSVTVQLSLSEGEIKAACPALNLAPCRIQALAALSQTSCSCFIYSSLSVTKPKVKPYCCGMYVIPTCGETDSPSLSQSRLYISISLKSHQSNFSSYFWFYKFLAYFLPLS